MLWPVQGDPADATERVALRMQRRHILTGDDAPEFCFVISEAALHAQLTAEP